MPRRTYKRKPRRRPRRRRKYKVTKPLLGNKQVVKMKYFHRGTLNPPSGGLVNYIFRANSVYDCDYTSIGHSGRSFDQLVGTLYDHYTVIGAKIRMKCGTDTGLNTSLIAGISLRDSSSSPADVVDYIEGRNCNWIMMSHDNDARTVTQTFSAKKFFSVAHPTSEKDLSGTVSTNPIEQAFFHCFASPVVNVDTDSLDIAVEIEYIVLLTEPKQPLIS